MRSSDYFLIKQKESDCIGVGDTNCNFLGEKCVWRHESKPGAKVSRDAHCAARSGTITSRITPRQIEEIKKKLKPSEPGPIIYHVYKTEDNRHRSVVPIFLSSPPLSVRGERLPLVVPLVVAIEPVSQSQLDKCRTKMSSNSRKAYLNRLVEQELFTPPSPQIYADTNKTCIAAELLSQKSDQERRNFLGKIMYPDILNWYEENTWWSNPKKEMEADIDSDPKLSDLSPRIFDILQLFFLTGDNFTMLDELDHQQFKQYGYLDLSRHHLSEIINRLTATGGGRAGALMPKIFALFTPADTRKWGYETRNIKFVWPNRTGTQPHHKLADSYASRVRPEDFQLLAGIITSATDGTVLNIPTFPGIV
jgi:hypothetical protein